MPKDPVDEHVRQMRPLNTASKKEYLQRMIGSQVDPEKCKHILHYRALLLSRLREEKIWPPA